MKIKILDSHLISQIAAGEVIERPSSIVKELLENSLDAGATEILLEIEKGGTKLIRIRDNGCGIAKDELSMALRRHATSKISSMDDLAQVRSLGFRGEALASIASVAKFRLSSRTADDALGWQITAHDGCETCDLEPIAHPLGTTVEVNELFFNLPVRKKFLRSEQTEYNHIFEMVGKIALSRFDVSLNFKHNGKKVFSFDVAKNAQESLNRVALILGEEFANNSRSIAVTNRELKLSGWISAPGYSRSQADLQYIYVNGRIIRDRTITHALRQAYQDLLFSQRHPAVVLFLELDPTLMDVNVHPTKSEVRFADGRSIHDFLVKGLRDSLARSKEANAKEEGALSPYLSVPNHNYGERAPWSYGERVSEACDSKSSLDIPRLGFALTQLGDRYILAENGSGLVVVDMHAAHERISYEKLKQQCRQTKVLSQTLLIPYSVSLNNRDISVLEEHQDLLQKIGLSIDRVSPDVVLVRTVPVLLQNCDMEQLVKDIAADLLTYGSLDSATEQVEHLLATISCHSSIRSGQKLSLDTMNKLLREIESIEFGDRCSHGRPTWKVFTFTELDKIFLRT